VAALKGGRRNEEEEGNNGAGLRISKKIKKNPGQKGVFSG
jgi:hypothetical protein